MRKILFIATISVLFSYTVLADVVNYTYHPDDAAAVSQTMATFMETLTPDQRACMAEKISACPAMMIPRNPDAQKMTQSGRDNLHDAMPELDEAARQGHECRRTALKDCKINTFDTGDDIPGM